MPATFAVPSSKFTNQARSATTPSLKIATMQYRRPLTPVNGHFRIAWLAGHVYTGQGKARLAGYLMPKLDTAEFHEIGRYLNPTNRKRRLHERGRGFAYLHLALMARNLAAAEGRATACPVTALGAK